MPSMSHQVLTSLFRDSPALGLHLFQMATKIPLPPGARARLHSAHFTNVRPPEDCVDAAYLIEDEASKLLGAAIVDIQFSPDEDKHAFWFQCTATMHRQLQVPVTMMVLAVTEEVERWCARPLDYDRAGNTFQPLVIGPSKIPRITDHEQARALPELAALSVAVHGQEPGAEAIGIPAYLACAALDDTRTTYYADSILMWLSDSARHALLEYLNMHHPEYQSEFARKYVEEGRKDGLEQGRKDG